MILMNPTLTIQDAIHLMQVLDNDIPYWDRKNIAFLLLILASNPDLVGEGKSPVGFSPRTHSNTMHGDWEYGDDGGYYGYGC